MIRTYIILSILTVAWCFGHSFFAATKIKTTLKRVLGMGDSAYRMLYNLFSLAGLAICILYIVWITPIIVLENTSYTLAVFILVLTGGLIIMLSCVIKYFRQMSGLYDKSFSETLEVAGLHRYVRHPLYLGTFIFLAGLWGCFPFLSVALFFGIFISYTLIGIRFEENKLVAKFGNQYLLYRERTPMILPRIRNKKLPAQMRIKV